MWDKIEWFLYAVVWHLLVIFGIAVGMVVLVYGILQALSLLY